MKQNVWEIAKESESEYVEGSAEESAREYANENLCERVEEDAMNSVRENGSEIAKESVSEHAENGIGENTQESVRENASEDLCEGVDKNVKECNLVNETVEEDVRENAKVRRSVHAMKYSGVNSRGRRVREVQVRVSAKQHVGCAVDDTTGIVTKVKPKGLCGINGVQAGFLCREVDGQPFSPSLWASRVGSAGSWCCTFWNCGG